MSGSTDINRSVGNKAAYGGGYAHYNSFRIPLGSGRLIADGTILASGAPPWTVTSAMGRIVWAANAATTTGVEWDVGIDGHYAASTATLSDELHFLMVIQSGASGTIAAQMTPTLLYQRAGAALSSSIALTGYKKAADIQTLADTAFTTSTTFTCTDAPTNPEAIMLTFRGAGLKPYDAARLTIAPSGSTNHATSLFGLWALPLGFVGLSNFNNR